MSPARRTASEKRTAQGPEAAVEKTPATKKPALPWLYEPAVLRTIVGAGLAHKFLMGTDFPILDSSRYERMFAASGIGEEAAEQIARLNALDFLSSLSPSGRSRGALGGSPSR